MIALSAISPANASPRPDDRNAIKSGKRPTKSPFPSKSQSISASRPDPHHGHPDRCQRTRCQSGNPVDDSDFRACPLPLRSDGLSLRRTGNSGARPRSGMSRWSIATAGAPPEVSPNCRRSSQSNRSPSSARPKPSSEDGSCGYGEPAG